FTGPLPPFYQEQIIFRGDNRGGYDPYFLAVTPSGEVEFQVQDANNNTAVVQAPVPANQFVYIVGSLNNTTNEMSLYINGGLAAQTFTSIRPLGQLDSGFNPGIGIGNVQDPSAYTEGFDGVIADAAVFNRSLPPVQPDFNNDGRADCLFQNTVTGDLVYWLMNFNTRVGAGAISPENPGSTAWQAVDVLDINGDDEADLLFQNTSTGDLAYWLLNGAAVTGAGFLNPRNPGSLSWQLVGVGDFNGDGRPDLLFQNSGTGDLAYWLMDGSQRISYGLLAPSSSGSLAWRVVGVADLNGDGWPDLVFQNQSSGQLAYWLMYGTTKIGGGFFNPSSPGSISWRVVGVSDISGDGRPDLLFRNSSTGALAYWYLYGVDRIGAGLLSPSNPGPNWRIVEPH
ncbi:MAG TPA: FG-GAP-like repeat-containing protein, partial [Chthonomonadales bacterium]|nr:FG-GAP-like repeat-containing protein [Chthonomonadales bacterium]